ncbi:MAG TPA: acyl-CoA dehydrogenase family protein [Candidatus Hydrogenedentes bacterium]|nr:acyl-CoA dehydrogenase family protein [Candidatus Hydrogenedentota bacterium]HPC16248.1 acyl-CoA dehydrogenase family protein [Candidatus Hydrogenedentota bacterium]HRT18540.1 acyl-CoA dehydrogenase family protein [Candidatus Hydrogenedentota bacterium]HRT63559.1 acyl-CoA dehydrogenase family protein [Candidatus Hydrogenedentota bacterium]
MQDVLLTNEERALKQEVREFVKNEVPPDLLKKMDRDEIEYPADYVRALGRRNLLGLRFSPKYGGRGLGWTAEIAALEEIGVLGMALGCAFSMPSIVGEALHTFGTEEQKERYLRPLLKGEIISAEALTEPRGGTDFFGATTKAELKDGHFTVRGQKRFVVGAACADFFLVYCNTNPTGRQHERISLLLIEKDRPGVETKYLYRLMGTRGGGTGRIIFKDVVVPEANLIGGLNQGAEIFNTMMVPERLTSAGGALGLARAALTVATHYTDRRYAFGKKIRTFQGVSFKVAEAITKLDAARALTIAAGKAVDQRVPSARRMVSEAKKFATEACWDVCNLAMQVVGGIGYTNIFPIERMVRDARLAQIWTGTNEIMSLLIQHEFYREVLDDPNPARASELDAEAADLADEKVYEDEEMWTKGW